MSHTRIALPDLECPSFAGLMLAGGRVPHELEGHGAEWRALLPLVDRPLAAYALTALQRCPSVDQVVLIGPQPLADLAGSFGATLLPDQGTMLANLRAGLTHLESRDWVILMGCDCPLLTTEILNSLLAEFRNVEADIYYPIVPRDILEAKYPGGKRTWVPLKEGTYTGGNLFLVRPKALLEHQALFDRLIAARKNPLKLASIFGLPFLFRLLTHQLSLAQLEARAKAILGITVRAMVVPNPEVGIDVDKLADYEQVKGILESKQERKTGFFAPVGNG